MLHSPRGWVWAWTADVLITVLLSFQLGIHCCQVSRSGLGPAVAVLAKAVFLPCLGAHPGEGTSTQLFHRPFLEGQGFPGLWGFSMFSETGRRKEWSLMGVLFRCVFFLKSRHGKPQKSAAEATGPSESAWVRPLALSTCPPIHAYYLMYIAM